MNLLKKLRKNAFLSWALFICFTFSHTPFVEPMASQVGYVAIAALEKLVQLSINYLLKHYYEIAKKQSRQQRLDKADPEKWRDDLALALTAGDLERANVICTAYAALSQATKEDFHIDSPSEHATSVIESAPSLKAIHAFLSQCKPYLPVATPSEQELLQPARELTETSTHETPKQKTDSSVFSESLSWPGINSSSTSSTKTTTNPITLPSFDTSILQRKAAALQERLNQEAAKHTQDLTLSAQTTANTVCNVVTTATVIIHELATTYMQAAKTVAQQKQVDGEIEKAIESNAFLKSAYKKAVTDAIGIIVKAHSPYTESGQQNHALLAMNHINIVGRTGRYIKHLVELINPQYFDIHGSLKQARPHIEYNYGVEQLIKLFQKISADKKEYHGHLHALEQAFTQDKRSKEDFAPIHTKIKDALKQPFTPAKESDFINTLYEMAPTEITRYGKLDSSFVTGNEHNQAFVKFIGHCLVDVTDPEQDPLGSFEEAKKFCEGYFKKKFDLRTDQTAQQRYHLMMKGFHHSICDGALDARQIPVIFQNDPLFITQPPQRTQELKEHIKKLAQRYQLRKELQRSLGIPDSTNEDIEKLLYAIINSYPENQIHPGAQKQELPHSKHIIEHLLKYKKHQERFTGSAPLFTKFFTPQGILKSLESKMQEYPEARQLDLSSCKNTDALRYANYFLTLDANTPEIKQQIAQGLNYILAATQDPKLASEYLQLAKAHYSALANPKADQSILDCGNLAKAYQPPLQKCALDKARSLALEGLKLQESLSPTTSQEERQKQESLARYALRVADIAQRLTAAGKVHDAFNMAHTTLGVLQSTHHQAGSFEFLVQTIDTVRDMPGAFDINSLLCTVLRKIDACKPDLIAKAKREAYENLQEVLNAKVNPGQQKAVQQQLAKLLQLAEHTLEQAAQNPTAQGNAAAVHADLLARLTRQAYLLNKAGKQEEAQGLLDKYSKSLIAQCEAYEANKEKKPQPAGPCLNPPSVAIPKGTCQTINPPHPATQCGTQTHSIEKEKQGSCGSSSIKEPKPKTSCNHAAQTAPSFADKPAQEPGKTQEREEPVIIIPATPQPTPPSQGSPIIIPTAVQAEQSNVPKKQNQPTIIIPGQTSQPIIAPSAGQQVSPIIITPAQASSPIITPAPIQIIIPTHLTLQPYTEQFLKWLQQRSIQLIPDPAISEEDFKRCVEELCFRYRDPQLIYELIENYKISHQIISPFKEYDIPLKPGVFDTPCKLRLRDILHSFCGKTKFKGPNDSPSSAKGGHHDFLGKIKEYAKLGTKDDRFTITRQGEKIKGCYKSEHEFQTITKKVKDMYPDEYWPSENARVVDEAARNILADKSKFDDGAYYIYGISSEGIIIEFTARRLGRGQNILEAKTFYPSVEQMLELQAKGTNNGAN